MAKADEKTRHLTEGDPIQIRGPILRIIFEKNGVHGLIVKTPEFGSVKVIGRIDRPRPGKTIDMEARYSRKRGAVFYLDGPNHEDGPALMAPVSAARRAREPALNVARLPVDRTVLEKYIVEMTPGVGEVTAKAICDRFKDPAELVIHLARADRKALAGRGIKESTAAALIEAWSEGASRRRAVIALQSIGLNRSQANRALNLAVRAVKQKNLHTEAEYNDLALRILRHPYRLTTIDGVGFTTADAGAQRLGMPPTSPQRATAAIRHCLQQAATEGHTAMFVGELETRTARILCGQRIDDPRAEPPAEWRNLASQAIASLDEALEQIVFPAGIREPHAVAALSVLNRAEAHSSSALARLSTAGSNMLPLPSDKQMKELLGFPLNDAQKAAARLALTNKVTVITGEPGTGKAQPLDEVLMAPRGYIRMGDIKPGTRLVNPLGGIVKVESIHPQGRVPTFRVRLSIGYEVRCTADHLWLIRLAGKHERVVRTSELIRLKIGGASVEIPTTPAEGRESWIWHKLATVEPTEKLEPCMCIKLTNEEGLYITRSGVITHNTTVTKAIAHAFVDAGLETALVAPTGRAAKRLQEVTGLATSTIHHRIGPSSNLDGVEAVVADEYSMTDIFAHASFLRRLSPNARLLMIGDNFQLPSVGPGAVLADIISSGVIPVARLTVTQRTASDSPINDFARAIRSGRTDGLRPAPGAIECQWDEQNAGIVHRVTGQVEHLLRSGESIDEIVVLTAMRGGEAGVGNLNAILQNKINPVRGERQLLIGRDIEELEARATVGDRVMQSRNDRELDIVNGDIGTIIRVNERKRSAVVDFGSGEVEIPSGKLKALRLAYACTVHKSQGAEFRHVLIATSRAHHRMMRRNLLYTGVTRAKQVLYLIGSPEMIKLAIHNADDMQRNTLMLSYLRSEFGRLAERPQDSREDELMFEGPREMSHA